ncbi:MAG: DUF2721 domain-containing protein [Verrucomicrobiaceae bacterium]
MTIEIQPGSIEHISQVISQVVAPAFLLGAVASYISFLAMRMDSVLARIRYINDVPDEGHPKSKLKADLLRQRRRATLLQRAMLLSIVSGVASAMLIIVAFAAALSSVNHAWATAILFVVSLGLLSASLMALFMDVRIGLTEYDHY